MCLFCQSYLLRADLYFCVMLVFILAPNESMSLHEAHQFPKLHSKEGQKTVRVPCLTVGK